MAASTLLFCVSFVLSSSAAAADPADVSKPVAPSSSKATNAQVKIRSALYAEQKGLNEERGLHLKRAIEIDPQNALARSLLGQINVDGKWLEAAKADKQLKPAAKAEQTLSEYRTRRQGLGEQNAKIDQQVRRLSAKGASPSGLLRVYAIRGELAEARMKLGAWCESNGLADESIAEYTNAVLLNPRLDAAWKKLGYVKYQGKWMSSEQASAAAAKDKAQKKAVAAWGPYLRRLKRQLGEQLRREFAVEKLLEIVDPNAAVAVKNVLLDSSEDHQTLAENILEKIPTAESSHILASMALYSDYEKVRSAAAVALKSRPAKDFALDLVEAIHEPAIYAVEPVRGPGTSGMLVVDTPRFRLERRYDVAPVVELDSTFFGYVGYDPNGLPVAIKGRELITIENDLQSGRYEKAAAVLREAEIRTAEFIAEANFKAQYAQQTLASDVKAIALANAKITETNQRAPRLFTLRSRRRLARMTKTAGVAGITTRQGSASRPLPKCIISNRSPRRRQPVSQAALPPAPRCAQTKGCRRSKRSCPGTRS